MADRSAALNFQMLDGEGEFAEIKKIEHSSFLTRYAENWLRPFHLDRTNPRRHNGRCLIHFPGHRAGRVNVDRHVAGYSFVTQKSSDSEDRSGAGLCRKTVGIL